MVVDSFIYFVNIYIVFCYVLDSRDIKMITIRFVFEFVVYSGEG